VDDGKRLSSEQTGPENASGAAAAAPLIVRLFPLPSGRGQGERERRPDASPARRGQFSDTAAGSIVSPLVLLVAVAVDVGSEVVPGVVVLVDVLLL
jgi:hypothetical protein